MGEVSVAFVALQNPGIGDVVAYFENLVGIDLSVVNVEGGMVDQKHHVVLALQDVLVGPIRHADLDHIGVVALDDLEDNQFVEVPLLQQTL